MALYFLEYDLRKQANYQRLYDALEKFKAVRILESMWCFYRNETTVTGMRDYFRQFIDRDDGIMVSDVSAWASYGVLGTPDQLK